MKPLHLTSFVLASVLHMPVLYGFEVSFFSGAESVVPMQREELAISYQTPKISPEVKQNDSREVVRQPVATSGYQALTPEEADRGIATHGRQYEKSDQPDPEAVKGMSIEKPPSVDASKAFVPTVENIHLESAEAKKIFFAYYDEVRREIKQHTLYPTQARKSRLEGEAYISFVITAEGKVTRIVLLASSGSPLLDEAAMNSIRLAEPFAAFPETLKEEEIKLNVPISFTLD